MWLLSSRAKWGLKMTELNQRHLALSNEIIAKYRLGHVSYSTLVNRLEETLFSLESPPLDWFSQASEKWEHLEVINALILGSNEPKSEQAKHNPKIDTLLRELEVLVSKYP
jgi:hypothetical protein